MKCADYLEYQNTDLLRMDRGVRRFHQHFDRARRAFFTKQQLQNRTAAKTLGHVVNELPIEAPC